MGPFLVIPQAYSNSFPPTCSLSGVNRSRPIYPINRIRLRTLQVHAFASRLFDGTNNRNQNQDGKGNLPLEISHPAQ
ncbi:hypothetical protein WP8W19C03_P11390 (plasmid) [Aeromonas veronii]|nr:hypothetical protein WP8S18C01_P10190 [Aeromonas caviae]BBT97492.1 hypothetical protein WP8W19C03_P11390 [Aeromonas veronii]